MKNVLVPGDYVRYTCENPTYMWMTHVSEYSATMSFGLRSNVPVGTMALVLAVLEDREHGQPTRASKVFILTHDGNLGWSWDDWFEKAS